MDVSRRNLLVNSFSLLVLVVLALSGLGQLWGGFLGFSRMQLVGMHTGVCYLFLLMVLVHLFLHRAWIIAMVGGMFRKDEAA
ncbi:Uncharacterised protein [uncultured archaeon]|nr:Uncharacterised protein [uncultured archaeon]